MMATPTGEAVTYLTNTTDVSTGRSVAPLRLRDLDQGRARAAINIRHRDVCGDGDAVWRPDEQRLATAGVDGSSRVWDGYSGG